MPIGYRIVAAEQRGSKIKKKLEIDPLHADTVRMIYRLFLEGDGTCGAMGVKAIATYLNERRRFLAQSGDQRSRQFRLRSHDADLVVRDLDTLRQRDSIFGVDRQYHLERSTVSRL